MLDVRVAEETDQEAWDAFTSEQEGAGPYHLFAWKTAMEQAYGLKTYYLIAQQKGGDIQGVLPLGHVKPPLRRGTLVSLPFCDYGGVLAGESAATEALFAEAMALSRRLGAPLEIRSRNPEPVLEERYGWVGHTEKTSMVLALPETSDLLWSGFRAKLRSQIRRPERDGLTFQRGRQELIEDFYAVFRKNMRDLGSPVHSRKWIQAVIEAFGERGSVCIVRNGALPVAGGILLCQGKTVSVPWASSLREYARSSPNMLLYWGFLKYATDEGFRVFDFGRSSPGEGTYRFKEQWGASPRALRWFSERKPGSGRRLLDPQRVRARAEKAWAQLPQRMADGLGPRLRKYISL